MGHRLVRAALAAVVAATASVLSGPVADAEPTGSISGTVTAPAGTDLARVAITVRPSIEWVVTATEHTGHPGPDGRYTISGLVDGDYLVAFEAQDQGLVRQAWPRTDDWNRGAAVPVRGAAVTGIDAELYVGGRLSGTVRTATDCDLTKVRVGVTSGIGFPLPAAVVMPDGRWSVEALPTNPWYGLVFDGRYAGLDGLVTWTPEGVAPEDAYLAVTPGSVRTGLDVTMTGPAVGCVAPGAYVDRLYRDLLGREAEPDGARSWVEAMIWGGTARGLATALASSDELRGRSLAAAYSRYLGRGTEPAGLAFWLDRLRAGWSIERVQAALAASDEFYATSGGTADGWVARLYRTVLDREPSPAETGWWVAALAAGVGRGAVASGFLLSTEHLTSVVDGYYLTLLRRHVDPVGARDWVALLQQGYGDEDVLAGIASSLEYRLAVPR